MRIKESVRTGKLTKPNRDRLAETIEAFAKVLISAADDFRSSRGTEPYRHDLALATLTRLNAVALEMAVTSKDMFEAVSGYRGPGSHYTDLCSIFMSIDNDLLHNHNTIFEVINEQEGRAGKA